MPQGHGSWPLFAVGALVCLAPPPTGSPTARRPARPARAPLPGARAARRRARRLALLRVGDRPAADRPRSVSPARSTRPRSTARRSCGRLELHRDHRLRRARLAASSGRPRASRAISTRGRCSCAARCRPTATGCPGSHRRASSTRPCRSRPRTGRGCQVTGTKAESAQGVPRRDAAPGLHERGQQLADRRRSRRDHRDDGRQAARRGAAHLRSRSARQARRRTSPASKDGRASRPVFAGDEQRGCRG